VRRIGRQLRRTIGRNLLVGPGNRAEGEAIGLAIMTELPLVIVNSQRGGPSTGLPTKTEQSDLYQAVYGRNGDAPLPVIAARSPADAFDCAIEAVRIATRYMTPVMLLTDGYIANAAEPWRVPDMASYTPFPVSFAPEQPEGEGVMPYSRNGDLARPWIRPGTPGMEHRIGGIEKAPGSGNIDYSAEAHSEMTRIRAAKVDGIDIPDQDVALGGSSGKLVIVGWGSTFGPIHQAVRRARLKGQDVSHIHIRHIAPMPVNLGELLRGYDKIIVPEMNTGQLKTVLRDKYLVDARPLNKVSGQPFQIAEIAAAIDEILSSATEKWRIREETRATRAIRRR
jgi:2-oxoglutarate ferredoxin oxidoreductase subunit alpha